MVLSGGHAGGAAASVLSARATDFSRGWPGVAGVGMYAHSLNPGGGGALETRANSVAGSTNGNIGVSADQYVRFEKDKR